MVIPEDKVIHLDVRDDLRSGREPFGRIMEARQNVPDGGALCLRAIFEPVPLYRVMERHGFTHRTERLADDDWRVWFVDEPQASSTDTGEPDAPSEVAAAPEDEASDGVTVIDVRGLEPPDPLVRTLEALEVLPEGHTLLHINVRVPRFLLPQLKERGFTYEIREQAPDLVRVFIRRADRAPGIL